MHDQQHTTITKEERVAAAAAAVGTNSVAFGDDVERRYALVTRDLQEVMGDPAAIKAIMAKRPLVIYWGTAPTGKPHLGYFVPVFKLADFLAAGCTVKILLADLHALLDNLKSTPEQADHRLRWYRLIIRSMLAHIGAPLDGLAFVRGSEVQRDGDYFLDLLKLMTLVRAKTARKAADEVVKMCDNPFMGNLVYPLMQALDEQHLGADAQLGGNDQRKIFAFARDNLPRLGHAKRFHLLNPLVPGLTESGKMSASEPGSKIDLDESDASIWKKIRKAHSIDGRAHGNGLLAILRYILWRWLEAAGLPFVAPRPAEHGGPQTFATYAQVEAAFARTDGNDRLLSADLKTGVAKLVCEFLAPLKKVLAAHGDLQQRAYPLTFSADADLPKKKERQ